MLCRGFVFSNNVVINGEKFNIWNDNILGYRTLPTNQELIFPGTPFQTIQIGIMKEKPNNYGIWNDYKIIFKKGGKIFNNNLLEWRL